jgi:uncharacterized protein with HEPN domain
MKEITEKKRWFLVNQLLMLAAKEARHLSLTCNRIKAFEPDLTWIKRLENNIEHAEMLDAFVSRFSRLQDTLGDKLLPALLRVSLEATGSQLDNLFRAEKIGWIESCEAWIEIRTLRNQLVHDYMNSAEDLLQALRTALNSVSILIKTQQRFANYAQSFNKHSA